MRNNEKPKTQTQALAQVLERSKSQSVLSQAGSVKSQNINKLPCESHYFEMQPLNQTQELHYRQRLAFFFTHEAKEIRPYPVALQEFNDVEYLPFFGSENQLEAFRKNKNKYRTSFYEEKSKVSEDAKKDITTPVPKHKYCQVCKMDFENYERHIAEGAHLRALRNSYGNDVIEDFVDEYLEKQRDEGHEDELAFLSEFANAIDSANSCFESELRAYADELKSFQKMNKQ